MKNFTATIEVANSPIAIFNHINNVSNWWAKKEFKGEFEGQSTKLNDEFVVRFGDVHYSKQKLVEIIPNTKVVWLVTDSQLNWLKNKTEWTNTKMIFEITTHGDKTILHFTHEGLVPKQECYIQCEKGLQTCQRKIYYENELSFTCKFLINKLFMTPIYKNFLTAINLKRSIVLRSFLFLAIFSFGLSATAQISGTVFRDFNGNGTKDNTASFNEPGVAGITVTAYNAAGAVLGTTVSGTSGAYSFTSGQIASGTKVRIEFTGWSNGDFPAPFGSGNETSVQFVTAPTATCNFGVNYPREYVDNSNPKVIIPGYVNGDNRVGGSTAAAGDAVYSYNEVV